MDRQPIEHIPTGDDLAGECNPRTTKMRKVIATLKWTDRTTTIHDDAYTHHWTSTHVRVILRLHIQQQWHQFWIQADHVEPHPQPIKAGDTIPALDDGPTSVQLVDPEACPNGHSWDEFGGNRGWMNCACAGSGGHHVWTCQACSASTTAPPHDPAHWHSPY